MTKEELEALEKAQQDKCDLLVLQREQELRNEFSDIRLKEAERVRRDRLWRDVVSQFFLTVRLLACLALIAWLVCQVVGVANKWLARPSPQAQVSDTRLSDTRFCVPPTCVSACAASDMRYARCAPCTPSCQPACPAEKQERNCGDRKGAGTSGGAKEGKKKDCPATAAAVTP